MIQVGRGFGPFKIQLMTGYFTIFTQFFPAPLAA